MQILRYILIVFLGLAVGNINQATAREEYFTADSIKIEIVSDYGRSFPMYKTSSYYGSTRFYVEARRDAGYSIKITNQTRRRIGIVIAVDGRNIISGAHSNLTAQERMYILDPHEQQKYSGWRTHSDQVNRFYFTSVDDSYADAWGDKSAMGVIAVAVFEQKQQTVGILRRRDSVASSRGGGADHDHESEAPGTGFGDAEYSPSIKVRFRAKQQPTAEYFFKYEWRRMLCRRGIAHNCHRSLHGREWDRPRPWRGESGFTPYPPSYAW